MMELRFRDRAEAGQLLASHLKEYANSPELLVLALPRGGVPVAYEVARSLHAPLDILLVRKLGVPGREELAMGAIATGGIRILNEIIVRALNIPDETINAIATKEQRELERRELLYRGDYPPYSVENRTIILIDDGIATGASMQAAVTALKLQRPNHIIIAIPAAAPSTCTEFAAEVDAVVAVIQPEPFFAVGYWYENFTPTTDQEVRHLLEQARQEQSAA